MRWCRRSRAPPVVPALWRYAELREQVMEAGRLITAEEAERRVLILENPALRGQSCITQSLYAGLQLILPGEVAPAHRHAQSALRLVLDGEGAYTAVDGERTTMRRGDFIITPAWTWHDHGNPGDQPVVWLDGLDIPLVRFLDAGFAEKSEQAYAAAAAARRRCARALRLEHGAGGLRTRRRRTRRACSSIRSSARAQALLGIAHGTPDAHFGFKLRYVNPATGASPMPTIGAFAQWLPAGFETEPYRSTDGTVLRVPGRRRRGVGGRRKLALRRERCLRRAVVAPRCACAPADDAAVQLLRPPGAAGPRTVARAAPVNHFIFTTQDLAAMEYAVAPPTLAHTHHRRARRALPGQPRLLRRPQLRRPCARDGQGPRPRSRRSSS